MQSKTLIGNQWQLDQGTKAVYVSQSATIQQDREISTGQKLQSFYVVHASTHTQHIIHNCKDLSHMYVCTHAHTHTNTHCIKVYSHRDNTMQRQKTHMHAHTTVRWSADGHVILTCSQTVIYQEAHSASNTTPWALKEELQDVKKKDGQRVGGGGDEWGERRRKSNGGIGPSKGRKEAVDRQVDLLDPLVNDTHTHTAAASDEQGEVGNAAQWCVWRLVQSECACFSSHAGSQCPGRWTKRERAGEREPRPQIGSICLFINRAEPSKQPRTLRGKMSTHMWAGGTSGCTQTCTHTYANRHKNVQ